MNRVVTITITFEIPPEVTERQVDELAFAATVQIEDPEYITTSNVRTSTTVEPRF
jgi:hypothetical protein